MTQYDNMKEGLYRLYIHTHGICPEDRLYDISIEVVLEAVTAICLRLDICLQDINHVMTSEMFSMKIHYVHTKRRSWPIDLL